MGWLLAGVLIILVLTWAIGRMLAFCRMEPPISEQKREAWK